MNPYKIYTLYYGKRDATTADYFLDDTANTPVGMGYTCGWPLTASTPSLSTLAITKTSGNNGVGHWSDVRQSY